MVIIFIGPQCKEFIVHKKLLCDSASFFNTVLNGSHVEGKQDVMHLKGGSPGAFSLYIDWLYRGTIRMGNTERHLHDLYDLYFLGEQLCLIKLKDQTMDAIQDMARKYDLKEQLITKDLVSKVVASTAPTEHTGLRFFCIYLMVYVYILRAREHCAGRENGEAKSFDSEGEAAKNKSEEHEGMDKTAAKKSIKLSDNDLTLVWEVSQNSLQFFCSFQHQLVRELQEGGKMLIDPRERDEEDNAVRCAFHCHNIFSECRPAKSNLDKLPFVPLGSGADAIAD